MDVLPADGLHAVDVTALAARSGKHIRPRLQDSQTCLLTAAVARQALGLLFCRYACMVICPACCMHEAQMCRRMWTCCRSCCEASARALTSPPTTGRRCWQTGSSAACSGRTSSRPLPARAGMRLPRMLPSPPRTGMACCLNFSGALVDMRHAVLCTVP